MFSPYGRANYDESLIRRSDSLLDVLVRVGLDVTWRDNQSGCKGVCDGKRIELEKMSIELAPQHCTADGCRDESLLEGLRERLSLIKKDTVIVLHQLGNHGPAYFARYPEEFRRFRPTCDTPELRRCSIEAIRNSYDNAILYTDYLLAQAVKALTLQESKIDSAMLYVSDHGESLGEHGIYLHGLPYWIAPDQQKKVPMLLWLSPALKSSAGIDPQCVAQRATRAASHDNLFHTVLGLFDITTRDYRQSRDVLAACRSSSVPRSLLASAATKLAQGLR
jgi:lipid A ethanolaminephosphotransferase